MYPVTLWCRVGLRRHTAVIRHRLQHESFHRKGPPAPGLAPPGAPLPCHRGRCAGGVSLLLLLSFAIDESRTRGPSKKNALTAYGKCIPYAQSRTCAPAELGSVAMPTAAATSSRIVHVRSGRREVSFPTVRFDFWKEPRQMCEAPRHGSLCHSFR